MRLRRQISTYPWRFARVGGVDQVVLRQGEDIARLPELDQKLWMVLCMPTRGIALNPRTCEILDTDKDGFIRPPEILAAVAWCVSVFNDLGCLLEPSDQVQLDAIKDPQILAGARRILKNLGKPDAAAITLSDVTSQEQIFANTRFNGDGVVPAPSADTPAVAEAIECMVSLLGGTKDRSGKMGIDQGTLSQFMRDAKATLEWRQRGASDPAVFPLPHEATLDAFAAVQAVRPKVDDFFARCQVSAFDDRARAAMNGDASVYASYAGKVLSPGASEMLGLPLALVVPEGSLPLEQGLNPAWGDAIRRLREKAIVLLLKSSDASLGAADWTRLLAMLAAHEVWQAARPGTPVMQLDELRLASLLKPEITDAIQALIQRDAELKDENSQIEKLEKMIRFQRDLYEVLTNYVNFSDFYGQTYAIFQAGSLYLDARACHLCIDVADPAKHAAMAGLSNAYLAYCDIRRLGTQRTIVAVITDGDAQNLSVGRNGVFYDRGGLDWSATITRIVSNPISVREAFWMPYRKLVRLIEDQIAKRAQAAEDASMVRMNTTASVIATADQVRATTPMPAPKKIELGTIALIGTAIGGMSALVGGFLQVLFGLGYWLPLGVLGIILLISGPSMLLAAIKLKQRNLGPVLDANGWAINTRARMNPAFGAALTELAHLPPGSRRMFADPYARRSPWWRVASLLIALAVVIAAVWCTRHKQDKPAVQPVAASESSAPA